MIIGIIGAMLGIRTAAVGLGTALVLLVGCSAPGDEPEALCLAGFDEFASKLSREMALLLRAKHGEALGPERLEQLALIVKGGAGLREPLRLQAAWAYLKQTRQEQVALADVLNR